MRLTLHLHSKLYKCTIWQVIKIYILFLEGIYNKVNAKNCNLSSVIKPRWFYFCQLIPLLLQRLVLGGSGARQEWYRSGAILALPRLRVLDNRIVSEEERDWVMQYSTVQAQLVHTGTRMLLSQTHKDTHGVQL